MSERKILGYAIAGSEDSRSFWDCRIALAGRFFHSGAPGAVVLNVAGHMLDLRSGSIYADCRFAVTVPTKDQTQQNKGA
jgi:hypothetical protein